MIPDLSLIVGFYVIVRFVEMISHGDKTPVPSCRARAGGVRRSDHGLLRRRNLQYRQPRRRDAAGADAVRQRR